MRLLLLLSLALAACGDDTAAPFDASTERDGARPSDAPGTDGALSDARPPDGTRPDGGPLVGCPRTPAPADRTRHVVVAHPFTAAGTSGGIAYEVLELDTSGALTRPAITFDMGTAYRGEIAITPDGEVGVVAQEDGSVGVFRLDATGAATVVDAAYDGAFYAGAVVMDPSGAHAWVLDQEWRDIGGGVYRLDIACDGSVIGDTLVAPSQLPYAMRVRADGTALLAARNVLGSAAGADAHIVDLAAPSVIASTDVWGDEDWILESSALTRNGRHFVFGDNAAFAATGVRIGVVEIAGNTLTARATVMPLEDPVAIATSPFDDAAIVVSGFGDAIYVLDYAPDAATPFSLRGELAYVGDRPALPGSVVTIERGALDGLVLVSENSGVRRVRFAAGGVVTDLGVLDLGAGTGEIVGAIGVTP